MEDILQYFFDDLKLSYFSDLLYKISDDDFKSAVMKCSDTLFSLCEWQELYEYLLKSPCDLDTIGKIKMVLTSK
ncbi:MAG: hypothetical protein RR253_02275 [Oscillospiraceae bacterium]